jgi:hypothetical protein
MNDQILLIQILRNHNLIDQLTIKEWELVIRQARSSGLLAHLYLLTKERGDITTTPPQALAHMASAFIVSSRQKNAVLNEIDHLLTTFNTNKINLILLKGAAYIASNLKAGKGRLLSDIDILIPQNILPVAEKALSLNGWFCHHHDEYDERYYRQWMHEIPPLTHVMRQSSLDVHHTILPPTAKYQPDPKKLLDCAIKIEGENSYTLSAEDMVIHSATHLFHEGEFNHGLRDLVDIATLLNELSERNARFWVRLSPRASELDLSRPLYYALRYAEKILGVTVPREVKHHLNHAKPFTPVSLLMDFLFSRALIPNHTSCDRYLSGFARWVLYVRSHHLKMPFYLLIPHLIRKAWKGRFSETNDTLQMEAHNADDIRKEAT